MVTYGKGQGDGTSEHGMSKPDKLPCRRPIIWKCIFGILIGGFFKNIFLESLNLCHGWKLLFWLVQVVLSRIFTIMEASQLCSYSTYPNREPPSSCSVLKHTLNSRCFLSCQPDFFPLSDEYNLLVCGSESNPLSPSGLP